MKRILALLSYTLISLFALAFPSENHAVYPYLLHTISSFSVEVVSSPVDCSGKGKETFSQTPLSLTFLRSQEADFSLPKPLGGAINLFSA